MPTSAPNAPAAAAAPAGLAADMLSKRDVVKQAVSKDVIDHAHRRFESVRRRRMLYSVLGLPLLALGGAMWIAFPPSAAWAGTRAAVTLAVYMSLLLAQLLAAWASTFERRSIFDVVFLLSYSLVIGIILIYGLADGSILDERSLFLATSFAFVFPVAFAFPHDLTALSAVTMAIVLTAAMLAGSGGNAGQAVSTGCAVTLAVMHTLLNALPSSAFDRLHDEHERTLLTLKMESEAQSVLLRRVIPDVFVDQLLASEGRKTATPHPVDDVTVMFCEVMALPLEPAGAPAKKLAANMLPSTLRILALVFDIIDRVSARTGVMKVETIGSEYMAVAGLPQKQPHHPNSAYALLVAAVCMMREVASEMRTGLLGTLAAEAGLRDVTLQIGLNSGPVIEGILGRKLLPRWKLFGDTVNTASRMKSNGAAGRIHMARATRDLIMRDAPWIITRARHGVPPGGAGAGGAGAGGPEGGATSAAPIQRVSRWWPARFDEDVAAVFGIEAEGPLVARAAPAAAAAASLADGHALAHAATGAPSSFASAAQLPLSARDGSTLSGAFSSMATSAALTSSAGLPRMLSSLPSYSVFAGSPGAMPLTRAGGVAGGGGAGAGEPGSFFFSPQPPQLSSSERPPAAARVEVEFRPLVEADILFARATGLLLRPRPPLAIKGKGTMCAYFLEVCRPCSGSGASASAGASEAAAPPAARLHATAVRAALVDAPATPFSEPPPLLMLPSPQSDDESAALSAASRAWLAAHDADEAPLLAQMGLFLRTSRTAPRRWSGCGFFARVGVTESLRVFEAGLAAPIAKARPPIRSGGGGGGSAGASPAPPPMLPRGSLQRIPSGDEDVWNVTADDPLGPAPSSAKLKLPGAGDASSSTAATTTLIGASTAASSSASIMGDEEDEEAEAEAEAAEIARGGAGGADLAALEEAEEEDEEEDDEGDGSGGEAGDAAFDGSGAAATSPAAALRSSTLRPRFAHTALAAVAAAAPTPRGAARGSFSSAVAALRNASFAGSSVSGGSSSSGGGVSAADSPGSAASGRRPQTRTSFLGSFLLGGPSAGAASANSESGSGGDNAPRASTPAAAASMLMRGLLGRSASAGVGGSSAAGAALTPDNAGSSAPTGPTTAARPARLLFPPRAAAAAASSGAPSPFLLKSPPLSADEPPLAAALGDAPAPSSLSAASLAGSSVDSMPVSLTLTQTVAADSARAASAASGSASAAPLLGAADAHSPREHFSSVSAATASDSLLDSDALPGASSARDEDEVAAAAASLRSIARTPLRSSGGAASAGAVAVGIKAIDAAAGSEEAAALTPRPAETVIAVGVAGGGESAAVTPAPKTPPGAAGRAALSGLVGRRPGALRAAALAAASAAEGGGGSGAPPPAAVVTAAQAAPAPAATASSSSSFADADAGVSSLTLRGIAGLSSASSMSMISLVRAAKLAERMREAKVEAVQTVTKKKAHAATAARKEGVLAPQVDRASLRFVRGHATLEPAYVAQAALRARATVPLALAISLTCVAGAFCLMPAAAAGPLTIAAAVVGGATIVSALAFLVGGEALARARTAPLPDGGGGGGGGGGEDVDSAGAAAAAGARPGAHQKAADSSTAAAASLRRLTALGWLLSAHLALLQLLVLLCAAAMAPGISASPASGAQSASWRWSEWAARTGGGGGSSAPSRGVDDSFLPAWPDAAFLAAASIVTSLFGGIYLAGLLFAQARWLLASGLAAALTSLALLRSGSWMMGLVWATAFLLLGAWHSWTAESRLRAAFIDQQLVVEQQARTRDMLHAMLPAQIVDAMMARQTSSGSGGGSGRSASRRGLGALSRSGRFGAGAAPSRGALASAAELVVDAGWCEALRWRLPFGDCCRCAELRAGSSEAAHHAGFVAGLVYEFFQLLFACGCAFARTGADEEAAAAAADAAAAASGSGGLPRVPSAQQLRFGGSRNFLYSPNIDGRSTSFDVGDDSDNASPSGDAARRSDVAPLPTAATSPAASPSAAGPIRGFARALTRRLMPGLFTLEPASPETQSAAGEGAREPPPDGAAVSAETAGSAGASGGAPAAAVPAAPTAAALTAPASAGALLPAHSSLSLKSALRMVGAMPTTPAASAATTSAPAAAAATTPAPAAAAVRAGLSSSGGASSVASPSGGGGGDFREPSTYTVSMLQFDLVGFTAMSADVGPRVVVELLDRLYLSFDRIIGKRGGLKVAIIGDAILVASGVPTRLPLHASARCVAKMSVDMLRAVESFNINVGAKLRGHRLNARIGIHCGEVLAGLIGERMPQFQVFGRAVDECQLMESSGVPGQVHASAEILAVLESSLSAPQRRAPRKIGSSFALPSFSRRVFPSSSSLLPAPPPPAMPAGDAAAAAAAGADAAAIGGGGPGAEKRAVPDIKVLRRLDDGTGFIARDRKAALAGIAW